jgi:molybdenum cofactor cytidylyltransferase
MDLRAALRVSRQDLVAFTGSGGKTTALFQLGRQLGAPTVLTTTTHLGAWQTRMADRHLIATRAADIDGLSSQIEGLTLITGAPAADERVSGSGGEALERLHQAAAELGFPLLIEADGARQRAMKAPGEREPVIPPWVNQVVVVAGLSGLGKPLDERSVHRVEAFARLSGIPAGEPITLDGLIRVLSHAQGGLKGIPAEAKRSLVLNQADQVTDLPAVMDAANQLLRVFHSVTICSLETQKIWANFEANAGIILAAGGASRYGQPKLLLEWQGKPLVRHVAEAALAAGLSQVVVVLGAVDTPIRDALTGLPVRFVANPSWQDGQSTSLKSGVRALAEHTGAALFLLADQPNVPPALIQALVAEHRKTQPRILATSIEGKRGNPVLFDQAAFADLLTIEGDMGGRALFTQHAPQLLEWVDPAVMLDVDTPEDFRRLTGEG